MFTRGEFIDFIETVFGANKLSNNGANISVVCPICYQTNNTNKKKLVIETLSGILHCWVCDYKSRNLLELLNKYHLDFLAEYSTKFLADQGSVQRTQHLVDQSETNDETKRCSIFLPNDFTLLAECWRCSYSELDKEMVQAIRYLEDRGITEEDAWRFRLGVTLDKTNEFYNRVIIPSFDQHGELNFLTGRAFVNYAKKYHSAEIPKETIVFNEIDVVWNEPLVLVEGPFDLMKCPWNATCVLGSSFQVDHYLIQKIIQNNTPVILAFDMDVYSKTLNKAKLLYSLGVKTKIINTLPKKNDIGSLKKELALKHIAEAKQVDKTFFFNEKIRMNLE